MGGGKEKSRRKRGKHRFFSAMDPDRIRIFGVVVIAIMIAIVFPVIKDFADRTPLDRMFLRLPMSQKQMKTTLEKMDETQMSTLQKGFTSSFEIVSQENLTKMARLLYQQHGNLNQAIRDFIQRMPLREGGYTILESLSTGWSNIYSITVIVHKKLGDKHKILIAGIKKEIQLSWLQSILPWVYYDSKQIEDLLTDPSGKTKGDAAKATLMSVLAASLRTTYDQDLDVTYADE